MSHLSLSKDVCAAIRARQVVGIRLVGETEPRYVEPHVVTPTLGEKPISMIGCYKILNRGQAETRRWLEFSFGSVAAFEPTGQVFHPTNDYRANVPGDRDDYCSIDTIAP